VEYLPPNTTSVLQPLDQAIIASYKVFYRRELIQRIADESVNLQDYLKSLHLKEVCLLGGKAWNRVTEECIQKSWERGLGAAFDAPAAEPEAAVAPAEGAVQAEIVADFIPDEIRVTADEARGISRIMGARFTAEEVQQWHTLDNDCPIYEHMTDEEIVMNVLKEKAPNFEQEEDDYEPIPPPPKASEAIEHLEAGLAWLETQEVDHMKVLQLRSILDFARSQGNADRKSLV